MKCQYADQCKGEFVPQKLYLDAREEVLQLREQNKRLKEYAMNVRQLMIDDEDCWMDVLEANFKLSAELAKYKKESHLKES